MGGAHGQSTDIQIQAKEILRLREVGNDILCRHTGQSRKKVVADTERDNFMTAEEAKAYGLIDDVVTRPPKDTEDDEKNDTELKKVK